MKLRVLNFELQTAVAWFTYSFYPPSPAAELVLFEKLSSCGNPFKHDLLALVMLLAACETA